MSSASDIAQGLLNVASDPCLTTVAQQLNRLHELQTADQPSSSTPIEASRGIGLCYAVTPLKAVVWARENPWVFLAVAGGVVGTIFGFGYKYGKRKAG